MEFLAREAKAALAKGQSAHHLFASRDDLPCSERPFYRHVEGEDIDVAKMGLRKRVRHKKRNRRRASRHEAAFYEGRTHADWLALGEGDRARTVETDCVEGAEGDRQALPTPHSTRLRPQICVLLERHDSERVVAAPDWLEGLLGGPAGFRRAFPVILTDRGGEFDDIAGIERGGRCRVFYTDPQRPDQKGGCEKAHVELRKAIPKGTPIDGLGLDAWIPAGICSNVNSSLRLAIGDASPMALAMVALPAVPIEGPGLELVPPGEARSRTRPARRGRAAPGARRAAQEGEGRGGRRRQRLTRG